MKQKHQVCEFRESFASEIVRWPRSAKEAHAWCSHAGASLPGVEVFKSWHADPDVHPYVLLYEGRPVAYGEIWADPVEQEIELARLIVAPAKRGQGLGQHFVGELLSRSIPFGFSRAYVRVAPDNLTAIGCYRKAGFTRLTGDEELILNAKQPTAYVWMGNTLD